MKRPLREDRETKGCGWWFKTASKHESRARAYHYNELALTDNGDKGIEYQIQTITINNTLRFKERVDAFGRKKLYVICD